MLFLLPTRSFVARNGYDFWTIWDCKILWEHGTSECKNSLGRLVHFCWQLSLSLEHQSHIPLWENTHVCGHPALRKSTPVLQNDICSVWATRSSWQTTCWTTSTWGRSTPATPPWRVPSSRRSPRWSRGCGRAAGGWLTQAVSRERWTGEFYSFSSF